MIYDSRKHLSLFESLPSPVILLDGQNRVDSINPSATALLRGGCIPGTDSSTLAAQGLPDWLQTELQSFVSSEKAEWTFEQRLVTGSETNYFQVILKRLQKGPGTAIIITDLSKLRLVEEGLQEMVQGISEATGTAFFNFLVRHLARAVDADYSFICEYCNDSRTRVRTVAVYADGTILENFEFDLAGTPCEQVVSNGLCCYSSGVQTEFPIDHLAIQMGVESYVGIPLINSSGTVLGPMALFGRKPLRDKQLAVAMLQIFAARAAAELERKHAEDALQEAESRLKTIIDSVQTGIIIIDAETHTIVDANEVAAAIIGDTKENLLGSVCHHYICASSVGQCPITDLGQEIDSSERTLIKADGTSLPVIKTVASVMLGGRRHLLESFVDISARKETEQALKASEERYRMFVGNQNNLVAKVDREGKFLFVSPSFCQLYGKTEQELLGTSSYHLVHEEDRAAAIEAIRNLASPPHACYVEVRALTREGLIWIGWAEKGVVDSDGTIVTIVGMGRDITDRKRAEAEIQHLAYYDTLTGLPNRALLQDRLDQAIVQASRDDRHVGVMFLDLDRFKDMNDSLGHIVGDRLLQEVADRLLQHVRSTDTVARLGGDEFVVVFSAMSREDDMGKLAQKILETLSEQISIDDLEIYTTSSIGIALYPFDGTEVDTLLKNANMAMYQAKEEGRNNFQFFSTEMNVKAVERMILETSLRRALERHELFLHYQPQIELRTNRIIGMEALIRWQHPDLGLLLPNTFIPLAEDTGLIIPIGEWMLRTACAQNKAWQEAGLPPLRLAINLSARQFKQHNIVSTIETILRETGLSARFLELELTESSIIVNGDETIKTLRTLKEMGITIAIDDFGTGYSSLSSLKHFPIDRLKIDRSFVHEITTNSDDAAIAEAIIAMAHSINLKVVAEGVEMAEQRDFLDNRLCDEMQGFFFSEAVSVEEFTRLLEDMKSAEYRHLSLVARTP